MFLPFTTTHASIYFVFLQYKRNGLWDFCLLITQNPSGFRLNKSVNYEHFKMDTLWTVIRMMKPNCYMASIHVKDAYYSVSIAATDQKCLKFEWQGKLYKFTSFPNDWHCAQESLLNWCSSLLTVTLDRKHTIRLVTLTTRICKAMNTRNA